MTVRAVKRGGVAHWRAARRNVRRHLWKMVRPLCSLGIKPMRWNEC